MEGANDLLLLDGKPVNLSEQTIEIRDFSKAYPDITGPAQHLNIKPLSSDISYFEVCRCPKHSDTASTVADQSEKDIGQTAFVKWSKILSYLEDHLGAVAVSAWLDDAVVIEFTEDLLKIQVGDDFRYKVVKTRCLDYIQQALKDLFNSNATVEVLASTD